MRPLFDRYPKVRDRVPFEPLVSLPTPVVEDGGVWVKRDDQIGGGVLRKLEFYRPQGELLAWGPEGSPWLRALAGRRKVRIILQRRGHELSFGLRLLSEMPRVLGGSLTLVPLGGSEPGATLGFVNAALELADQVARGECPKPDAVFVPLGTGGTTAGLALGFALAGLDVALHAVRVASAFTANLRRVYGLVSQAACLLDEWPRVARLFLERRFPGGAAACLLARREGYRTPLLWLTSPPVGNQRV